MKSPTGILGFDDLIGGGMEDNTICVIVGGSGSGKTLFCLQFLLEGLHNGETGAYFTLEQGIDEIIREAENIGWPEVRDFVDSGQLMIHTIEADHFQDFVTGTLPQLKKRINEYNLKTRIVVDPITPVLWEINNKSDQRKAISSMFSILRCLGTTFVTVEQHTSTGEDLIEKDVSVPVFLSDAAVLLRYLGLGEEYDRLFRVIKMRTSPHGSKNYPLEILPGLGVVVFSETPEEKDVESKKMLNMAISLIEKRSPPATKKILLPRLEKMKQGWKSLSGRAIEKLLKEYDLM